MTAAAKKAAAPKVAADPIDESKATERAAAYQVTAPLIAVAIGSQVLQYSSGDILPSGVDGDLIKRLTNLGFVTESE